VSGRLDVAYFATLGEAREWLARPTADSSAV
ncbi:MAG: hypothetical protein QOG08_1388, partial [Chloroflexota bacterium]|nr:hypothetical protein [Chloroflexota bacterium]